MRVQNIIINHESNEYELDLHHSRHGFVAFASASAVEMSRSNGV